MAADNRFLKMLKDELGVTLQIDNSAGMNAEEKIGIMIASGDLPDFMYTSGGSSRFIQTGNVMSLDEWLPIAPNINKHVTGYRKMMSHPDDGKLYVLPNYNRFYGEVVLGDYDGPAFFIQKAVLEEFNFPVIKTLDDYFELLQRYKDKYPTIDGAPTIGFAESGAAGFAPHITNPPLHLMGQANNGNFVWLGDRAELFGHGDSAKRYLQTMNKYYQSGLIDQEMFTQSSDQYQAKLATGRILGVFDEGWAFRAFGSEPALRQAGMYNRTMVATTPTWPGYEPYYRDRPVMNLEQGYGINVNSPRRAQAVALINTLLEEKWQKLMTWGVEGVDYQVNAEGRYYRTPEQRANREDAVWRARNLPEVFWDSLPKTQGTYSDGNSFTPANQAEEWQAGLSDYDKAFLAKAGKETWAEFAGDPPPNPVWYPLWTISVIDGSDAQLAATEYNELLFQYYSQLVANPTVEFEKTWQAFLDRVKAIDTAAYEQRFTEQALIRIREWGE
jgi:putative aldouronate transport system substrate-binding protein